MAIEIKTRVDERLYKSLGAGQTTTEYRYTTGPRNLMKAVRELHEHRKSLIAALGNVGAGHSWIEVDGVVLSGWTMVESLDDARSLIAYIQSGRYEADQKALQEAEWC